MITATDKEFAQPIIQSISTYEDVVYRLVYDFSFEWAEDGEQWRRTVFKEDPLTRKEWSTDLASVPGFAAALGFLKCGTSDAAAILHDRAYQVFGTDKQTAFPEGEYQTLKEGVWVDAEPRYWTRMLCDRLYRRMCIAGGMSSWRANIQFLALRIGAISRKNGIKWYFS